jgi:hypothetical protein
VNDIVKQENTLPAQAASETAAVLAVIERIALNKDVDVDRLERMLQMQERIIAKQAESAFNRDMAAMQAELPTIQKNGKIEVNNVVRSTYARFEDINEAVKPIMQKYGFAVTFKVETADRVKVTGILTHREGHRETTDMVLPVDASGSKNAVQAIGSSVQYGKRYVMCALLNISTGDDDDGEGSEGNGMPETEYADHLAAIEGAADKASLEKAWKTAAEACHNHGDREAHTKLKEAATKRGKALK